MTVNIYLINLLIIFQKKKNMPRRKDLKKILVIGAGPIIIGQACEFDYSGTQACKALREEGYKVILINSNPATIMTDPEIADKTYIEPITTKILESIIKKEKPCAILPTMGGQTALNMTMQLKKKGLLKKYKVELIGANSKAISNAENRKKFRKCMREINIDLPKSEIITDCINCISTSFSDLSTDLAKIGIISIVARLSFLSILLNIEVSISSAAATFLRGNPLSTRAFRIYSPNVFILL